MHSLPSRPPPPPPPPPSKLPPSPLACLCPPDVETEVWPNGTVAELAARTQRFLVTRGKEGADEWRGPLVQRIPVFPVRGSGWLEENREQQAGCCCFCGTVGKQTAQFTSGALGDTQCQFDRTF